MLCANLGLLSSGCALCLHY